MRRLSEKILSAGISWIPSIRGNCLSSTKKSSSLHHCSKCGFTLDKCPSKEYEHITLFPYLLHHLIWCKAHWENAGEKQALCADRIHHWVCFLHKQDQNYLIFLWLHTEPCTITMVGQIQVQHDTCVMGKHWRRVLCLPGGGRWCLAASAVHLTDSFINQLYRDQLSFMAMFLPPCYSWSVAGKVLKWHTKGTGVTIFSRKDVLDLCATWVNTQLVNWNWERDKKRC